MRNLLGYLTYRDSRDQGVKMVSGVERWTNRGMGGSVAEIAHRCDDLRSDHVLTFSLVINPNPQIMAMIPLEQREGFVRELTERTVDDFFEARGLDTGCEFSYVLHHRESDDPQAPGLQNPHTHVVLPGTVWSEESGERISLYFSRNKKVNHIEILHEVTEQNMADMLDHTVGLDWEQRMDALEALRQEQKRITEADPHGYHIDDEGGRVPFWGGIRQVDESNCAVGYYMPFQTEIQFRPIAQGLDTDFARIVTESVAETLPEFPEEDALELYRATVKRMVESDQADIQPRSPELEL